MQEMIFSMDAVLFVAILFTVSTIVYILRKNKVVENSVETIISNSQEKSDKARIERTGALYDSVEKTFTNKIDEIIQQSGMRKIFPFMSAELLVFLTAATTLIVALIVFMLVKRVLLACFAGGLVIAAIYIIVYITTGINYKRTQDEIMSFIDTLDSNTTADADIVNIMWKSIPYIGNPIKTEVEKFYANARTMDTGDALKILEDSIEHKKFKMIINNLRMAYSHEANYSEVIKSIRKQLISYLEFKEMRDANRRNQAIMRLIMILMGGVVMKMSASLYEGNIFQDMYNSTVGLLILISSAMIVVAYIISLVKFDKR